MSKRGEILRALVTERLTAAAEEIFTLFERTIAEYEEELCRSKEEDRLRGGQQDAADVQLKPLPPKTEEFSPSPGLDQPQSEVRQIKLEQEDLLVKQEEELGFPAVVVQVDDTEEQTSSPAEFSGKDRPKEHESNESTAAAGSSTQIPVSDPNVEDVSKAPQKSKDFVCGECGKAFSWRVTWRRHVATHSDSSPYTCSVCAKRFPQKSHLVTHMVTHTGEKPFGCSQCSARFSQKQNLARHMSVHGGNDKSFVCADCGKLFSHRHSLRLHMLTHTGEKPVGCSLCEARFTNKTHLNRHVKCCHRGERPFSCTVCGKGFTQRFDVLRHMKVHEKEVRHMEVHEKEVHEKEEEKRV